MTISAGLVKELREITGAGMMDCKSFGRIQRRHGKSKEDFT